MTNEAIVAPQALTQATKEKLKQLVASIERGEAEKAEQQEAINEIYAEAKALGFDTKVMRRVIALRRLDRRQREEAEQIETLYLQALGDI
jgi:uncharacterized protein (UPF0335 family)